MFVKKLVEKATKKPGGNSEGLKHEDLDPRVAFHHGIPFGATMFAYDSIQKILAISTKDGRLKLLGKDNTEAVLESTETLPSKFLQFLDNQGILLNVTTKNRIEVWDIDRKLLSHVHEFSEEITSFTAMQQCFFIYVGDSVGNVTVLKLDRETHHITRMAYRIPFSGLHGNTDEIAADNAVVHILPHPTTESQRILLIYSDGCIALWAIRECKPVFTTGRTTTHLLSHEEKKVTSACWACPFGTKIAVGYSSGDIFIFAIPSSTSDLGAESTKNKDLCSTQNAPICKLNLGYRLEKIPIISLKCAYADVKVTRLYVMGASDSSSANSVQVILLNEDTESRTVKLGLQLPEPCLDMGIVSGSSDQIKHKQGVFILLGKSGHMYAYDDHLIEKYLLQSQSKSPPSIPRELKIKLPFADSSITCAQYITNNSCFVSSENEDYRQFAKNIPSLLPSEPKQCDHRTSFTGFAKIRNLYITGHYDGTIRFWDVTGPLLLPLLSLTQQGEDGCSSAEVVTAIFYDNKSRLLFSGDKSGMVRIYQIKSEPFATDNSFFSLQGSSKKGINHLIQSVRMIKVNGSVFSITINSSSRHLAVGTEQGYISLIDIEGPTIIYQKQIASELCSGVISLQFEPCNLHGFEKNVLVAATRDSSVLAFDSDTGSTLSTSMVQPKKPSRALFMQILDGQERVVNISDGLDSSKAVSAENTTSANQLVLLCSEKALYVYSLTHVVQGIKKVLYKKKFHSSSCCWASTFRSPSNAGLVLLLSCGRIEIRSLPDLSLVKETTRRSFTCSPSSSFICSSPDGEIIMARSDQEIVAASVLLRKEIYRHLDSFSQVYDKNVTASEEDFVSTVSHQTEKKKGLFGSVIKGSKTKHGADTGAEDLSSSFEELSTIFSTPNFPSDAKTDSCTNNQVLEDNSVDLDIDDIDLDDPVEKPKGHNVMASLNTQKLASKFHSFKGKLKQMTTKSEKTTAQEEPQNENTSAVNEIKKKYGFSGSSETNVAKLAASKLAENSNKLQGINLKTTEMKDGAQSFSSMANELLKTVERDNKQNP